MAKANMRPCFAFEFETPKKVVLNGLWFGPRKPKRVIVWVHGLSSSVFSKERLLSKLADSTTAVLAFNNRGHDIVSGVRYANGRYGPFAGEVHEVFTDSFDDIEGAVRFARRSGARDIYIGGSSTGSQKAVYWTSRTQDARRVRGLVLGVPLSDHASVVELYGERKVQRALGAARRLIAKKRPHDLLPQGVWHQPFDAQRFVSLYSGESAEELFPYWDAGRRPKALHRIKLPMLVLLAGNDEYSTRPVEEIARWFDENIRAPHKVVIVPKVGHSFKGGEAKVAREVKWFIEKK